MPSVSLPTAIAGGLTALGVGSETAGVLAPALLDAGLGAGMSALTGNNVGAGALMGGIGGLASGAMGVAPQAVPGGGGVEGVNVTPTAAGPSAGQYQGGYPASAMTGAPGGALTANAATAARTLGNSSPLGGLNGLAGLIQYLGRPKPVSTTPGVAQTGPYWNKPLQNSGAINRTLNPNYAPATGNWQTYGQAPEQPFYSNNQVTFAKGGALSAHAENGAVSSDRGDHYVSGDEPGQSDRQRAMLSDGEYILDASTVARIGSGNSNAGAKILDKFRHQIATHQKARSVVPPKAKSPLAYLREAKR